jgi:uncharacterized protein (DUF58 family)
MNNARLRLAFALGAGALAAAVASGSRALGVVGVGFLLAAGLTWMWTWLAEAPVRLSLAVRPTQATEGDRLQIAVELDRSSRIPLGAMTARATVGRLGEKSARLHAHGRRAIGEIDLGSLPRGVHAIAETEVLFGDLLGLVSVTPRVVCDPATVIVRPRLFELDGLFSDSGRTGGAGRRLLLRRTAGFDFHSVRDYEPGESLRRVHWPTSARRGQLMVKELEDTSNDGVVVVLDCDPTGAVGEPPDSSFDAAVRAAGSILRAHAARGRPATLVSTGYGRPPVSVRSAAADLEGAVTALAAAEADARHGLARFLAGDHAGIAGSAELAIVTATIDQSAIAAMLGLCRRHVVSVVWVDAASFAGRPTRADPGVLRLAAHGVPTAVVRRGDDLAVALSASPQLQAVVRG